MRLKAYRFPSAWGFGVSAEWSMVTGGAIRVCDANGTGHPDWPWVRWQVRFAVGPWCVVLLWPEVEVKVGEGNR